MAHNETIEADFDLVLNPGNLCVVGVLVESIDQQSRKERSQQSGSWVLVGQRSGDRGNGYTSVFVPCSLTWREGSRDRP